MKVNKYLVYNLSKLAPKGLFNSEQPLTKGWAQLPLTLDVPKDTTTVFILLGDVGDGVEALGSIPVNKNVLDGKRLAVSGSTGSSFELYANAALEDLLSNLNDANKSNDGLAPTQSFRYNDKLFQWMAMSLSGYE